MKNSYPSSSSSLASHHSIYHNRQQKGARFHKCDLCAREFTSGNALGGHKAYHRGNNFLQPKIKKDKHSCVLCSKAFSSVNALNGHMKWHSQYGSKKGSKNYDQDQYPPIDLRKYLPAITYLTKKRSMRLRDDFDAEAANVAEIMLDFSRQSSADVDGRKIKEQSGHEQLARGKNNEKNRLVVRLKIPKGLNIQTSQARKQPSPNDDNEENNSTDETDGESSHEMESNISRGFDLNELPADDVADETKD